MRLVDNAKHIWHRLWSVRLMLLVSLLSTADSCMAYYASGQPHFIVMLSAVLSIAAAVARLVAQDSLRADNNQ